MTTDNKWTHFKLRADINTDVRSVYEAWATQLGLESWFLRRAEFYTIPLRQRESHEFIKKEDTYTWYWHGYSDENNETGQILEANGYDMVRFSFSGGSIVTVSMESKHGITVVELLQDNIPLENDPDKNILVQCKVGWMFYLANLKSILEGGIDLRNKRMDVSSNFK